MGIWLRSLMLDDCMGSGKERVAGAASAKSSRCQRPFLFVNAPIGNHLRASLIQSIVGLFCGSHRCLFLPTLWLTVKAPKGMKRQFSFVSKSLHKPDYAYGSYRDPVQVK